MHICYSDNKKECDQYDFTTTSEVSDLEEEPSKRKSKKKLYKDCVTGMFMIYSNA